ncbi:MAG: hypothetical protein IJF29_06530 [Firmicutes bacterium]|nr:hypothetical protein [Bacillota bacterium]
MHEFLRQIIPVSMDIWVIFFILPAFLSFIWQLWLCLKSESLYKKFVPVSIPVIIAVFILIYRFVFIPFGIYVLGFVALFLIGTSLFMLGGITSGWVIYGLYSLIRKDKRNG